MSPVKERLIELIRELPDDSSLNDILYQLYFRRNIEEGLQAAAEGRVISDEEMEQRMEEWLPSDGASPEGNS